MFLARRGHGDSPWVGWPRTAGGFWRCTLGFRAGLGSQSPIKGPWFAVWILGFRGSTLKLRRPTTILIVSQPKIRAKKQIPDMLGVTQVLQIKRGVNDVQRFKQYLIINYKSIKQSQLKKNTQFWIHLFISKQQPPTSDMFGRHVTSTSVASPLRSSSGATGCRAHLCQSFFPWPGGFWRMGPFGWFQGLLFEGL